MDYNEILQAARTCMGPYCKACPCATAGPAATPSPDPVQKRLGVTFQRNYQKWQEICVQMDTICENRPADTTFDFFRCQAASAGAGRPRGRHEAALRRQIR